MCTKLGQIYNKLKETIIKWLKNYKLNQKTNKINVTKLKLPLWN